MANTFWGTRFGLPSFGRPRVVERLPITNLHLSVVFLYRSKYFGDEYTRNRVHGDRGCNIGNVYSDFVLLGEEPDCSCKCDKCVGFCNLVHRELGCNKRISFEHGCSDGFWYSKFRCNAYFHCGNVDGLPHTHTVLSVVPLLIGSLGTRVL